LDVTRFDTLTRSLARRTSRRQALRTGSGFVAAALAGSTLQRRTVLAAPAPVPEPVPGRNSTEEWPVCSEERPDYCISRFEVGGVDRLTNPTPEIRPFVAASINSMLDT